MALYQYNAYGDSPCDYDRLDRLDRCEFCDDTIKFYDDKMQSIRELLHPLIRKMRGIEDVNPELIDVYIEKLMEETEFKGWECNLLKKPGDTK